MNKQQIGRCGELLVQLRLLLLGVESSPMTTDYGIDLVAFSQFSNKATTIQVKTNEKPKPGGGKGKLALDWWISINCPAEIDALVDLSKNRVWLFTHNELKKFAQQKPKGRLHFYMYVDPDVIIRSGKLGRVEDFDRYLLENRGPSLFLRT